MVIIPHKIFRHYVEMVIKIKTIPTTWFWG